MRLISVAGFSKTKLVEDLRKVKLRGHDNYQIYSVAEIETVSIRYHQAAPCQSYVLKQNVARTLTMFNDLRNFGINPFAITTELRLQYDTGEIIPLLPPIIEQSVDRNGSPVTILNDGMHRLYVAKLWGRMIDVVKVSNLPDRYPYYAYPVEDRWQGVKEIETLTEDYKRKDYRDPENYKALFRDFDAVFPGVQKKRENK